jgi:ABC-type multidrug transport system ATPase subunit
VSHSGGLGSLPVKALEDTTDEVTLAVTRGEVFGFIGFIGFNGAGKSTTSDMLCTLARPASGTARPSLGWL